VLYPLFARHGHQLRNRIVCHFEHGLHASKRFSGRYEVVLWFTKGTTYTFNLDVVHVPQKYPNKKHFKGPHWGQLSGNPLGKNPGDLWMIPNVKANHVEKTIHPCQFPVELVERLVLALTDAGDCVLDPFMGVGSTAVAALMHGRRAIGAEIVDAYVQVARERIDQGVRGELRIRPMDRPVHKSEQARIIERPSRGAVGRFWYVLVPLDGLAPWTSPPPQTSARASRDQHDGAGPVPDPSAYRAAIDKLLQWADQNDWEVLDPLPRGRPESPPQEIRIFVRPDVHSAGG
jgi:adenine-specific DNA-methyltransferase